MLPEFGRWLIAQNDRHDWIGLLAAHAAKDPAFPIDGSPDDVRLHLAAKGSDPDSFEMLDDAERAWAAGH